MKKLLILSTYFLPVLALAAPVTDIESGISVVGNLLNRVAPLIIGIAFVFFIWGIVKYVTAGGDDEKQTEARQTMIYGIIALFVMTSVWGLVNVLAGTFQLQGKEGPTNIPRAFDVNTVTR